MIAGMGKAHDPGPGSRVDNPQDVEVVGDVTEPPVVSPRVTPGVPAKTEVIRSLMVGVS
jgi:hypothetical protein